MSDPQPSPQRKRRVWKRVLLGAVLLLAVLLAGLVVFRQEIATRAAVAYLEGQGIAVQGLEVTRLTPGAVEVRGLALGNGPEAAASRILAVPRRDGLAFSLEEVVVEGLRLRLDVTGDAPLLGSLQPAFERLTAGGGDDEAGGTAPTIPRLRLAEAQVELLTPSGPMAADLTGRMAPDDAGGLQAEARLDLDSELGRLRAQVDGRRRADETMDLTAAIAEGRFAWEGFRVGALGGDLRLAQDPGEAPRLTAKLDLKDLLYAPENKAPLQLSTGQLSLDGTPQAAELALSLEGGGEFLDLVAEAQAIPAGEARDVALTLEGELRTAGGLAPFLALPGPQVTAGTLVFQADGSGRLPAAGTGLAGLFERSDLRLTGEAILGEVALADGSTGISGHLPLAAEVAQDRLTLILTQDAELRVEQPSRQTLQDLGLPEDVLPLVASGLSLTLQAAGELPFRLAASPVWPPQEAAVAVAARGASDQGLGLAAGIEGEARLDGDLALAAFSGRIDGRVTAERLALGGREARGIEVALPLTTRYDLEGLSLALTRPGALNIRQFGRGAPLRLQNPLAFAVKTLNLQAAPDAASYLYSLEAAEDGAALSIARAEAEPLEIIAGALDLRLEGSFARDRGHDARLDLWLDGFELPGHAVATEAAEVSVELDPELRPDSSRFRLGPIAQTGGSPALAPLTVTGELRRRGTVYDITGILGLAGGRAIADLTARYADSGEARLEAVSRLLSFAPDSLQPADLSPLLSGLEEVSGTLTGKATLAWPPDPQAESGRVTLSGLDFKSPAGQLRGLDLDLVLTRLLPPASATGQKLTIAGVDAAVPVNDVEVVFALDQAPRPQLAVARAGFGLAGARWRVEPLVVDPAAQSHRVVLGTENLDLAAFFDLIGVDGLAGEGRLHGRIPITFEGEDVIVEDGRFEAEGPGVLNIRIDALRSALAGSGETVEMAARALEDFRYENLTLDLDKTAENDATLRLSTLGSNPAVMDGQPFQFNINLESNLTSVLAALRQGYSLSDDALRRAWRLRE